MTRILAVSDEVDEALYGEELKRISPDLVVSCGDLPFDYLEYIVTMLNVPLLFVPGNHDPGLSPDPVPLHPLQGLRFEQDRPPGPQGCINVDGEVRQAAGLVVAGLGGSVRYSPRGANQYTQREMRWRALRLEWRCRLRRRRPQVIIAHSPPSGAGDQDDPAHQGFQAFNRLIRALRPRLFLHGHIHPYGIERPDRWMGETRLVNVIPYRVLEVEA